MSIFILFDLTFVPQLNVKVAKLATPSLTDRVQKKL